MQDLTGDANNFLFGMKTDSTGRDHVMSPSAALHFGDTPELYLGAAHTERGILVEAWTSCQYSPQLDATMNVTWYFSGEAARRRSLGV